MITSKYVAILVSVLFLFIVVELVRRERLTFKYAAGWLAVLAFAIVLAIFDKFLFQISGLLGFELPSNFIFFTLMCIFVFLGLLLTIFLCQQDNRNDTTAQKIGLLEFEIQQLKEKVTKEDESGNSPDGTA